MPATERLKSTDQIKELYEGWIVHESHREHLITVIFTDLPEGLHPGEKLEVPVEFDGYYFKVHAYETSEKNPNGTPVKRRAPLLIGRTISLGESPTSVWDFAPVLLCVLAMVGLGVIGLMFWFRQGDKKVHQLTHEALTRTNPFDQKGHEEPPLVEPGNAWNRIQEEPPPP